MRKLLCGLLLVATAGLYAGHGFAAERKRTTTRPRLERIASPATQGEAGIYSMSQSQVDSIKLSGYDKPLRSRRETVFVTNATDANIARLTLSLSYFDMQGRELHHSEPEITVEIPVGATRQISFPSWDRQLTFVYYRSERSNHGVPYTVKATVVSATATK